MLTIYNDEPVESTYDLNGSLVNDKKPGQGLVVASGPNPDNETYTVTFQPGAGSWTALGIEVVQDESLPGTRVARGADRFVVTEVEAEHNGTRVPFVLATTAISNPNEEIPAMAAIDGDPKTGWGLATYNEGRNPMLALRFAQALDNDGRIDGHRPDPSGLGLAPRDHRAFPARSVIGAVLLARTGSSGAKAGSRRGRHRPDCEGAAPRAGRQVGRRPEGDRDAVPVVAAGADGTGSRGRAAGRARVHSRLGNPALGGDGGDVANTHAHSGARQLDGRHGRNRANPRIPGFLGKLETGGRRATRLDLANWLVSTDNPLTRARFRESDLAAVLRDRASRSRWTTSGRRANGRRIPSCSTGSRPSSWTRNGRRKARMRGT